MISKNYHLSQTWDEKYRITNFEKYDWIENSNYSFQKLNQYLPNQKDASILELGCGTSSLCQILIENGYSKITCVDFSKRLIKSKTEKANPSINYVYADFTEPFKFQSQTKYDLIIDKGSIDCVFCNEDYLQKVLKCITNCYNRLNNNGKLISFSLGHPKNRKYWFRNKLTPFQLEFKKQINNYRKEMRKNAKNYDKAKQENNEEYYIYICTKNQHNRNQENEDEDNMHSINIRSEHENDLIEEQNQPENKNNSLQNGSDDANNQQQKQQKDNQEDENIQQAYQDNNQDVEQNDFENSN